MANRFGPEYRLPFNGGSAYDYDMSKYVRGPQDSRLPSDLFGFGKNPFDDKGDEPSGGVRVPRTPLPKSPSGGMALSTPTKVGLW